MCMPILHSFMRSVTRGSQSGLRFLARPFKAVRTSPSIMWIAGHAPGIEHLGRVASLLHGVFGNVWKMAENYGFLRDAMTTRFWVWCRRLS